MQEADLPSEEPDFDAVFAAHRKAFSALYSRISVEIAGDDTCEDDLASRLAQYRAGGSTSLPILYMNFARYLMISSAGTLPTKIQVINNFE